MTPVIEAKQICKSYAIGKGRDQAPTPVLDGLDFHAEKNEFVTFVGPSGCGKSTLFNIITGLLKPDSGNIFIDGQEMTGVNSEKVGYVLQKDLLFPWRTVIDNVVLGLELKGVRRRESHERAREMIRAYHMEGFENKYPAELSGGMRQRVALMRTMITDPEIILMDESYKALDYPLKISLESELLDVVKASGKTVIFITHDIEEAVTLSDRIYVMRARPGQIVNEIAVDLEIESHRIPERRLSPRFNDYYEMIWKNIDSQLGLGQV